MKLKLTFREFMLAIVFAIMGFLLTMRQVILFLDWLNPIEGLLFYYGVLYSAIYILSKFDLVIFGVKISRLPQTIGVLLITFAFFICVDWESAYIQYVTSGSLQGVSPLYLQSEDGAVFWGWQQLLPSAGVEAWRLLTYVVSPFVLSLIGGILSSGKVKFK